MHHGSVFPISAAYAYSGSVVGKATKAGVHQSSWEWALYALAIAITIAVTCWITQAAHRALKSVAPELVEGEK